MARPAKKGGGGRPKGNKKSFNKSKRPQQKHQQPQSDSEDQEGSGSEDDQQDMLSRIRGLRSDSEEGSEAGGVASEDDEELDSDMADTDGEEGPVKKPQKKPESNSKKSAKAMEIDLNEDSDAEPEQGSDVEAADGMVDLSQMLDAPYSDSESEGGPSEELPSEDEDQEDEEAAVDKLDAYIESLGHGQAGEDPQAAGQQKKRKLAERTETQPESEFAPVGSKASKKLRIEDMLSTLPADQAKDMQKSLKPIIQKSTGDNSQSSTLKRAGAMPAPLDSRSQAKLDRKAAKAKLDEHVDGWNAAVAQNKGIGMKGSDFGSHRITLPLNAPNLKNGAPSAAELGSHFSASNDLEKTISGLLQSSAMSSQAEQVQNEQEAMSKMRLSAEDQAARQAAVRRQRELLFRAERKNKRLNKIKSKAYRRLARKEAAKENNLSMEELQQLDELDEGDRVAKAREKMEMERAKERAGLRHSSKTNRFAREINGMHGLEVNDDLRKGEMERVQREAALRRKIQDHGSGSDEDDDSGAENVNDDDEEAIRQGAIEALERGHHKDASKPAEAPKGLMGMKFMQAAMARKEKEAAELEEQFRREMAGESEDEGNDDERDHAAVEGNAGRRVFVPSKNTPVEEEQNNEPAEKAAPKEKNGKKNQTQSSFVTVDAPTQPQASTSAAGAASDIAAPVNPWLAAAGQDASTSKASTKTATKSTAADKSQLKTKKQKAKLADERDKQKEENQVVVDPSQVMVKGTSAKQRKPRKSRAEKAAAKQERQKAQPSAAAMTQQEAASGEASIAGGDDAEQQRKKDVAMPALDDDNGSESDNQSPEDDDDMVFRQRDLVARAFEGDDVVADFEAQKEREIQGDAPQDIDATIPGWGSWGGRGVRKPKNKKPKFTKHIAGIDAAARKDAGLNHVILSEKRERQAAKYLVKDLPHPYISSSQHEQALRVPLGPEWQTGSTHRSFTRPQVLTRMGQVIDPISKQE